MDERPYYAVLNRFELRGQRMVSIVMVLRDQPKAEALAKFLTDGKYFDPPAVTVEGYPGGISKEELERRIAAVVVPLT
jgi:hypothetical protein